MLLRIHTCNYVHDYTCCWWIEKLKMDLFHHRLPILVTLRMIVTIFG